MESSLSLPTEHMCIEQDTPLDHTNTSIQHPSLKAELMCVEQETLDAIPIPPPNPILLDIPYITPPHSPRSTTSSVTITTYLVPHIFGVCLFIMFLFIFLFFIGRAIDGSSNNPLDWLTPCTIAKLQGRYTTRIIPPHWELWRFLTPMFIHAHWIHLCASGTTALLYFYYTVYTHGYDIAILVCLTCGTMGHFVSSYTQPYNVGCGSSVCTMGMWAFLLVTSINKKQWIFSVDLLVAPVCMLVLDILQVFKTDVFAHWGAYICGLFIGIAVVCDGWFRYASLLLLLVYVIFNTVMLSLIKLDYTIQISNCTI